MEVQLVIRSILNFSILKLLYSAVYPRNWLDPKYLCRSINNLVVSIFFIIFGSKDTNQPDGLDFDDLQHPLQPQQGKVDFESPIGIDKFDR